MVRASSRGRFFRPKATFSRIERCGNSAKSWNISPMLRFSGGTKRAGPAISCPSNSRRPGVGLLDPGGDAQQRGLAAARRPEQAGDLARLQLQAHIGDGRRAAEALRDMLELEKPAKVAPAVPRGPQRRLSRSSWMTVRRRSCCAGSTTVPAAKQMPVRPRLLTRRRG